MRAKFIKAVTRKDVCPPKFVDDGRLHRTKENMLKYENSRILCSPESEKYHGKQVITIIPDIKKKYKYPKPLNPCARSIHPKDSWQLYRSITVWLCFPLIMLLMWRHITYVKHHKKEEFCRQYEYMGRRTKRFPWGEGEKSLFHNSEKNYLPWECIPFEEDEDDD